MLQYSFLPVLEINGEDTIRFYSLTFYVVFTFFFFHPFYAECCTKLWKFTICHSKCLATASQHHRWLQRCVPLISPTPPIHLPACLGQGMGTCTGLQNLPWLGNTGSAVPVPWWCHANGVSVPPALIAGVVAVFGGTDLSPPQMVLPENHACSVQETCFLIFSLDWFLVWLLNWKPSGFLSSLICI